MRKKIEDLTQYAGGQIVLKNDRFAIYDDEPYVLCCEIRTAEFHIDEGCMIFYAILSFAGINIKGKGLVADKRREIEIAIESYRPTEIGGCSVFYCDVTHQEIILSPAGGRRIFERQDIAGLPILLTDGD
jgi:hypothetical protein